MGNSHWRDDTGGWPDLSLGAGEIQIDPAKVALLIVDMQNFDADPDGTLVKYCHKHDPSVADYLSNRLRDLVVPNNVKMLDFFRRYNLKVVYITIGPELVDWSDMFPRRKRGFERVITGGGKKTTDFVKGRREHDIIDSLRPLEGEVVINKTSSGAFNSTDIDRILFNLGVKTLVITGVATNVCVETTARGAADRGYDCILIDDACATFEQGVHDTTMKTFSKLYGCVSNTDDVIKLLGTGLQL